MRGPFDPPVGRQSSVVLLTRQSPLAYSLVISISTRGTTEVLDIGSITGQLGLAKQHTFTDEGFEVAARGSVLLGFTATDSVAGLLIATRLKDKATLPGGHVVYLVAEAQWALLPLATMPSPSAVSAEQEFWRALQQYSVAGAHYFCETADLTRPFPSAHAPTEAVPEFVWNTWLSAPLHALGLSSHCPSLLQGAVEAADELHPTGQRYTLVLLSRRSRRHPGTRYIARGLNEFAGPGNEIEAELLMWTPSAGAARVLGEVSGAGTGAVQWARVAWRRGTVPVWWGVELQPLNKGLQAEVYVREEGTFVGMLSYFRTLHEAYSKDARPHGPAQAAAMPLAAGGVPQREALAGGSSCSSSSDGGADGRIICINLLHMSDRKAAELMLSMSFEEGLNGVQKRMDKGAVRMDKFDWHGNMGSFSEERGVEAFWHFIQNHLKDTGLAMGCMERCPGAAPPPAASPQQKTVNGSGAGSSAAGGVQAAQGGAGLVTTTTTTTSSSSQDSGGGADTTPWAPHWRMRWHQRQRGVLRFNCADSLDRTNAAACFAMLPALQEGLRLLGIPLDLTSDPAAAMLQRSPLRSGLLAGSAGDLTRSGHSLSAGNMQPGRFFAAQGGAGEGGSEEVEVLPPGWARGRYQGRTVYVDHVSKSTQWEPPPGTTWQQPAAALCVASAPPHAASAPDLAAADAAEDTSSLPAAAAAAAAASSSAAAPPAAAAALGAPWAFFAAAPQLEEVRARLYCDTVADYVEMFRKHGDILSSLYTGSSAMHSHILGLVLPADRRPYAASAGVGKLQNLKVAVQRRWNNTMSDAARQQSIELFLGLNVTRHCPGIRLVHPASSDLPGPDPDDTADPKQAPPAAQLQQALPLHTHDGRVGIRGDLAELDPLPPEPLPRPSWGATSSSSPGPKEGPAAAESGATGRVEKRQEGGGGGLAGEVASKEDRGPAVDATDVALDPLGAVRVPLQQPTGDRGSDDELTAATAYISDLLL